MRTALALITLFQNPEVAKDLTIQEIWQLISIVDRWVQYHMKGEKAIPSTQFATIGSGLTRGFHYEITALSGFLYEEIYRRAKP